MSAPRLSVLRTRRRKRPKKRIPPSTSLSSPLRNLSLLDFRLLSVHVYELFVPTRCSPLLSYGHENVPVALSEFLHSIIPLSHSPSASIFVALMMGEWRTEKNAERAKKCRCTRANTPSLFQLIISRSAHFIFGLRDTWRRTL